jgi:thiaminase
MQKHQKFLINPIARGFLFSAILMQQFSSTSNANINYDDFIKKDCSTLFKKVGASDKIIYLWNGQASNMKKILSSKMVQGMKNNTLTRKQFDDLYMKPDVIYIYNLGLALEKRANQTQNAKDKENIMMLANMFLGYQNKHHRFEKYNLNLDDKLEDKICNQHIDLLANKTNIDEYYISILTDMMPYVCFANYLYNTIDTDDNIWMAYAKKYGTYDSEYVSSKLAKSIELANTSVDKIPDIKAQELFQEGMNFESYFIEEAMNGSLVKKINMIR